MVILSAGSLSTPQILERSGIGNPNLLQNLSIELISPLPGVGENYQDHHIVMKPNICRINADDHDTGDSLMQLQQDPEYMTKVNELFESGKGPLACNFVDAGIKYRPTDEEVTQLGPEFRKVWDDEFNNKPDKALFWMGFSLMYPPDPQSLRSRSTVMLTVGEIQCFRRGNTWPWPLT
jgi:alcohol oxidase